MRAITSIVRPASLQDAAACVAIYRPYVQNTTISWEIEVPSVDEMASRIASAQQAHEWLVLEERRSGHRFRLRSPGCIGCLRTHGRLRRVSTSAATVIAQAAAASSTRKCWIGSPSAAIDKLSPASRNPTRPAIVFIDPLGFRMLACTGASNGNTTAGTTSHGCNSVCSALPTRVDPLVQSLVRTDPGRRALQNAT